jgi:TRAP-type uncharacterized transport system substrate-binding protein
MLSNLYYVPMWIFYRDTGTFNHVNELRNHRVAVGAEGSGTRSLVEPVFALNKLTTDNTTMVPLGNDAALHALKSGEVDAAVFVDGAQNQAVWAALHDPHLRLMSYGHADAYSRLLPYIKKLTLPSGVIDVAHDMPEKEVALVGTKAMLAARDGLHPALIELLVDAAHEIHGGQGLFEEAGEPHRGSLKASCHEHPSARTADQAGSRFSAFSRTWGNGARAACDVGYQPITSGSPPLFNFAA